MSTKHKPGARQNRDNVSDQHWRVKWGPFAKFTKSISQRFVVDTISGNYVLVKSVILMRWTRCTEVHTCASSR